MLFSYYCFKHRCCRVVVRKCPYFHKMSVAPKTHNMCILSQNMDTTNCLKINPLVSKRIVWLQQFLLFLSKINSLIPLR